MQTSAEHLDEMGLEDPNFDGKLNEKVGADLAEVTIDEDAQRRNEIDLNVERLRKRALERERVRKQKEAEIEIKDIELVPLGNS